MRPPRGKKGAGATLKKQKAQHDFVLCFFYGAGDEARTRYLDLGKVALYQMSYARATELIIRANGLFVNPVFNIFHDIKKTLSFLLFL